MKPLVIGPGKVATPYGTALSDLLGTKRLTEAIIASAFLTRDGAERLVDALRLAPKRAKVTLVVGSMAGFTRKAAIRYLQSFESGRKRKLLSARLRIIHPFETDPRNPCFHVKAAYARIGRRGHLAIIGSHNLTADGLDSAGELGVWLEKEPAKSIGEALRYWLKQGTKWSQHIRRYKQAKRIPGLRQHRRRGQEQAKGFADVGPFLEMEPLSPAEAKRFDRLCAEHDRAHDGHNSPALLVRDIDALPAGSVFDSVDYRDQTDQGDWALGARRGIAMMIRYFPDGDSREGLLVYRWLRRYQVTPETIRIARGCGVYKKQQPTGEQLWMFERRLRSKRVRGWN